MTIWLRTLPPLRSPLAVVGALVVVAAATACGPPAPQLIGKAGPVTERVTVSQFRDLEPAVQQAAFDAARDIKAGAALLHGGTIGLRGLYRNGVPYALAPINGQYPMGAAAVDPASAKELYGADVGRFHDEFLAPRRIAPLYGGPRDYPEYRAGYHAVFFEDPDRLKLEVAHIP